MDDFQSPLQLSAKSQKRRCTEYHLEHAEMSSATMIYFENQEGKASIQKYLCPSRTRPHKLSGREAVKDVEALESARPGLQSQLWHQLSVSEQVI